MYHRPWAEGKKIGKSTPAAPDYTGAAQQQAASSRDVTEQQTWANRPTINTPFGQQTWESTPTFDPATGQTLNQWTQNTNLTPEAQHALDSQMSLQQGRSDLAAGLLGRAQQEYGQPMDWSQFTATGATPQAQQYGQNLPDFGQAPTNMRGYGQDPQQQSYSPEQLQRGLSTEGLQNVDNSSQYYNKAGDAIFNQWSSRNDPKFQKDQDMLRTQLYNQGLKEGDQAYNDEMQRLRESQTDARNQASYDATIGAGQEASRMQGMDMGLRGQQFGERSTQGQFANSAADQALQQQLGIGGQRFNEQLAGGQYSDAQRGQQFSEGMTGAQYADAQRAAAGQEQLAFGQQGYNQQLQSANYQNQLRQQQIAEQMQQRGFSLNEINAILSGQQVGMPSMPSFNTAARSEGTQSLNAAQMTGQHDLDVFNAQQQATQGALSGIAGGAMMFSDKRLKKNIRNVGKLKGLNFYVWDWIFGGSAAGVMADEVVRIPGAVVSDPSSGYDMVDYGVIYG